MKQYSKPTIKTVILTTNEMLMNASKSLVQDETTVETNDMLGNKENSIWDSNSSIWD